jgi:hypothetical protein
MGIEIPLVLTWLPILGLHINVLWHPIYNNYGLTMFSIMANMVTLILICL